MFTYLLVNHVPLLHGSRPGTARLGDLWHEDLCAQAAALARVGGKLVVATPFGAAKQEGSFQTVEIDFAAAPFVYEPLPNAERLGETVRTLPELRRRLAKLTSHCDIAHIAFGGHPIPPGAIAWRIAGNARVPRILAFDGSDEVERRWEAVKCGSRAKLPLRWLFAQYFESFCRESIVGADLVFAHNAAIPQRFATQWGAHCHVFPRSFVTDAVLATREAAEARALRIAEDRELVFAVVGRLVAIKATDHALRALAIARKAGARVGLLVIGDGDALASYRALATELGIAGAVTFTGALPYGDALFQRWDEAHATLVTNLTAEISRNVLLSLGRGTPLVMYENAGTDALLPPGVASLVPRGNVEALARQLVALSDDRATLAAQVLPGHAFAECTTLEVCHRRRAELAASVVARSRSGGA